MSTELLNELLTQVIKVELAFFSVFFVVALGLFLRAAYRLARARWAVPRVRQAERKLHEFLDRGDVRVPPQLEKWPEIRDLVVRLATHVAGDARNKLLLVYRASGFVVADIATLKNGQLDDQMHALNRMRTMGEEIPKDLWPQLLEHANVVFRWAAMEHLLHTRGVSATFSLIRILSAPENQSRGMMLHLLCCLAKLSPESIPWLLEHCDAEILKEQMLHTLHVYPVPGTERLISRTLRTSSPEPILIAGIRALLSHPHAELVKTLALFSEHPDWIVRVLIAKGLAAHATVESLKLLGALSEDVNFYVRSNATRSLLHLRPHSQKQLEKIRESKSHPSYYLHNQLILTERSHSNLDRRAA